MSSSGTSASEQLILAIQGGFTANDCVFAATTALVYDYLITFPLEVQLFWRGNRTGACLLFFANRYLTLFNFIFSIATSVQMSDSLCTRIVRTLDITLILQYIPWALIAVLRVFALSRKNYVLSVFVLLLSFVTIGVNSWTYSAGIRGVNDPMFGCSSVRGIKPKLAEQFTVASRSCLLAADLIVILVTWTCAWPTFKRTQGLNSVSTSLHGVLLYDGSVYFIVLAVLNTLHMAFTVLSRNLVTETHLSLVTIFTEPLTAILVSRFLLDLQAVNRKSIQVSSHLSSSESSGDDPAFGSDSLVFAGFDVVGSLGSSLARGEHASFGGLTLDEDEEEKAEPFGNAGGEICEEQRGDVDERAAPAARWREAVPDASTSGV